MACPLAGVMHEGDRGVVVALQRTQEAEQRGELTGGVLIDGVQAHERVEDEERGAQVSDRGTQCLAILFAIEPEAWHGDDMDIEGLEVSAGGMGNALEPPAHDWGGVLRGIEQHRPNLPDREAAQTGRSCGDRDGEIKGEEGFAALWLAADDADGLSHPQSLDEPGLHAPFRLGKKGCANGGKRVHGRLYLDRRSHHRTCCWTVRWDRRGAVRGARRSP